MTTIVGAISFHALERHAGGAMLFPILASQLIHATWILRVEWHEATPRVMHTKGFLLGTKPSSQLIQNRLLALTQMKSHHELAKMIAKSCFVIITSSAYSFACPKTRHTLQADVVQGLQLAPGKGIVPTNFNRMALWSTRITDRTSNLVTSEYWSTPEYVDMSLFLKLLVREKGLLTVKHPLHYSVRTWDAEQIDTYVQGVAEHGRFLIAFAKYLETDPKEMNKK
jgi:hypothetical protein